MLAQKQYMIIHQLINLNRINQMTTQKVSEQKQYSTEFYQELQDGSLKSAEEVVPFVMKLINPKTVVDIGCGVGTWLAAFEKNGVKSVLGVDGDYVNLSMLKISTDSFLSHNLEKPFNVVKNFDLAISLEVAEHLHNTKAKDFVHTLTDLASVVLFSAAVPHQSGTNHINEQWQDYWIELFKQKDYVVIDCLRRRFWNNPNVEWWYSQNMFIFVKKEDLKNYPLLEKELEQENGLPIRVVHPRMHSHLHNLYVQHVQLQENNLNPNLISVKLALRLFLGSIRRYIMDKLIRTIQRLMLERNT